MYQLDLDALSGKVKTAEEGHSDVTLDEAIDGMAQMHMKHNTLMAIASAVSAIQPNSTATVLDITMDAIGAVAVDVTADDAGEDAERVFEMQYDDEAFQYALGVTMDFAGALGISDSAMLDLYDEDAEVAMDEAHNFASAINSAIHEEGDLAQLVTAHVHFDSIVADYADEAEAEVTLDNVTMDWSFSKKKTKRKAKTGTGHTMKTVECHRTIDGVRKKGFCRYPKSLLKGKYKKASGVSSKQKTHLAQMVTDAHTGQAERRRSLNMKLTREARSGSGAKSSRAKM